MIICVDIGGTSTRIGLSDDGQTFSDIIKFSTSENFHEALKNVLTKIDKYADVTEKISLAVAGSPDRNSGELLKWGQKHDWENNNFLGPFRDVFKTAKINIGNDADVACLGEAVFGAGRAFHSVGFLTISTGIGGGFVIDKSVTHYDFGFEPGHQIINYNEENEWSCGQKGCFEAYACGTSFEKMFGVSTKECSDPEIWEKYAKLLAIGVANCILMWSPEIMVIGGGVSNKYEYFKDTLAQEVERIISPIFKTPPIVKTELDEPGLYGGLVL